MRKGEQTRQRIVEVAAVVLNQHGYSGSGMADLMRETGLAKGGLYRHFDGKESLAAAAFDYALARNHEPRLKAMEAEQNSVDKLRKYLDSFVSLASPIPGGCPILNTGVEHDDGNALLFRRSQAAFETTVARIYEIIDDGKSKGEIKAEIVPQDLALFLFASLEGAIFANRLDRSKGRLRIIIRQLQEYLEQQVRASSGKRSTPQKRKTSTGKKKHSRKKSQKSL